ncbi:MAG: hypothetical protein B1H11_02105 [Desulfobacteraceae bacterium 4484_190.1]|nr:MAG: hypothetical protein B1H11_02105 [Desulfobacteraceae bacterium 4484_190.1]
MKRLGNLMLPAILVLALSACTGHMRPLTKIEIQDTVQRVERDPSYLKLEQAQQTVALALEYYDQGGYEKSAGLFLEAVDLYRELGARDEERRALIAAAKVQLKCSQRQPFLLTMARFKGLLPRLEMPSEEERFLINLSDHMKGRPLTYPVKEAWQVIFRN